MKGSGDTITKLDDICQERIGIRIGVTVAFSRIMMNIEVVFHQCPQMIISDDPPKYPTLYPWRNAASHRSMMAQSLKTLYNKLIEMPSGDKPDGQFVQFPNCYPSLTEPEARRSSRCEPNTPSI